MALDQLKLRFGPAPDDPSTAVGIAFLASPAMRPDLSVSSFETYRFAKENYPQLREYYWQTGVIDSAYAFKASFDGSTVAGYAPQGAWEIYEEGYRTSTSGQLFGIALDDHPIVTSGVQQTRAGSWGISITTGVVYRSYTVPTYENTDMWFMTGCLSGVVIPGTQCILVYTVPEAFYGTLGTSDGYTFPGQGYKVRTRLESAHIAGPNRITFSGNPLTLKRIVINGADAYSGTFTDSTAQTGPIKELNRSLKWLDVRFSLNPNDLVELEYTEYAQDYLYLGYTDASTGVYYPFDCNPEFGHVIGDHRYGALRSASECLLEQVTVYAIPSAVGVFSLDTTTTPNTINLKFYSAFDFSEKHFIRHIVGEPIEDIVPRVSDGPTNTYGFAVFGRNYYDEPSVPHRDIFSTAVPSMLPLSRVLLKAPASVGAVAVADARKRGGGVPEDANLDVLVHEPGALDELRGYYDLGNWSGKMAQVGGVALFKIDKNVLQPVGKFTEASIMEIVKMVVPVGVDFTVEFI